MHYTIFKPESRAPAPAILLLFAAGLVTAGCGSGDDEPAAEDAPGLTNVEPREAVRKPDEPEVPVPGADSAPAQDDITAPLEKQLYAVATLAPASGSSVSGELRFHQDGERMSIRGTIEGLAPGEHGLHIHTVGDCSAPDASSAGGHFDPMDDPHGSPDEPAHRHHHGDLGNITADADGIAQVEKDDAELSLETGEDSILGRAVVVHADADDLASQPSGAAGKRVGCGVIEFDAGPAFEGELDAS